MTIKNVANRGRVILEFIDLELYKNKSGIYMIENMVNHKKYIGQTSMRFIRRYWHHQWLLDNNKHDNSHLQKAWNKYGKDNFSFSILEVCENKDDLDNLEIKYINKYDTIKNGYNIQTGGNVILCNYISPESRKRVGELNRKRMLGTKLSKKTREKMSLSRCGEKNGFAKLTRQQVIEIRQMIKEGYRPKEIYQKYNITYGNFKMIRANKTWKDVQI